MGGGDGTAARQSSLFANVSFIAVYFYAFCIFVFQFWHAHRVYCERLRINIFKFKRVNFFKLSSHR